MSSDSYLSKHLWLLFVAIPLAFVLMWVTGFDKPVSYEEAIVRASVSASNACEINDDSLDSATVDEVAICVLFGGEHFMAVRRYPEFGTKLYEVYGGLPEWRSIIDSYGHAVLPIVWSFHSNGSVLFETQNQIAGIIKDLLAGKLPEGRPSLSDEQYGYLAIAAILETGHNFLGQFEIVNGHAAFRPVVGTIRVLEDLLIGGIEGLEKKLVRGEETSYADWGWAALDGVLLSIGGTAVVKGIKGGGKLVTVGGKFAALKVVAVKSGKVTVWVAKKVAPLAVAIGTTYLVIRHPVLVTSFAVSTLQSFGISTIWSLVITFVVVTFLLWPVLWLALLFLKGLLVVARPVLRSAT